MSYLSDLEAAGGLSPTQQEADAAERELEQRVDSLLAVIDDTLQQRAERLRQNLAVSSVKGYASRERALILDALRATLKDGVEAAGSGAVAEAILKDEH